MGVRRRSAGGLTGQGLRFAVVGSLSTLAQLGLYAFLSGSVGAQLANICAWLVSTMLATAGHHRYTFGLAGRSAESDHLAGLLTSLTGLGLSSVVLAALDQPAGPAGTVALVAVNTGVGALRFLALRWWLLVRNTRVSAALREPVVLG
jgi:putative flippase GtrA